MSTEGWGGGKDLFGLVRVKKMKYANWFAISYKNTPFQIRDRQQRGKKKCAFHLLISLLERPARDLAHLAQYTMCPFKSCLIAEAGFPPDVSKSSYPVLRLSQ